MTQEINPQSSFNYPITVGLMVLFMLFVGYCYLHGIRVYIIVSGSMEPALAVGSLVLVQPEKRYYPGQVISYYRFTSETPSQHVPGNNQLTASHSAGENKSDQSQSQIVVTHRIMSILNQQGEPHYRTKGDVNNDPDGELISHQQVIGRVVLVIPLIGYLFVFPQSKLGFYLIVFLSILWIVLILIKKVFKR